MLRASRPLCALAALAVTIALAGCGGGSETTTASLPFAPHASLTAIGGTTRSEKPKFVFDVVTRPGDANIRSATVNLPPVVLVDPNSLGGVCPERQLASSDCAGHRKVGEARALSPAYEGALSGPVYAVSGSGGLPRLAYVLSGPAEVLLYGRIVSKGGRIQAGVEDVPDTPLKSFELTIEGGKPGYLILSHDICKVQIPADATFTSQEGDVHKQKVPLTAGCGA